MIRILSIILIFGAIFSISVSQLGITYSKKSSSQLYTHSNNLSQSDSSYFETTEEDSEKDYYLLSGFKYQNIELWTSYSKPSIIFLFESKFFKNLSGIPPPLSFS